MRKVKLGAVKGPAQGHPSTTWWDWDLNLNLNSLQRLCVYTNNLFFVHAYYAPGVLLHTLYHASHGSLKMTLQRRSSDPFIGEVK